MRPMTLLEPFRALFYAPFYLAEARGGFARQGIDLRLVTAGTTDAAAAKLLAGEADLAWSGPMRPLLLRSQDPGCTLRSFCAVVMRDPFLLLGAAPRPGFMLQDLAGLRLGLVSEVPTPAWCLKGDFVRAGIDQRAIRTVTGRSMPENAAALAAGTLDGAQCSSPSPARWKMPGRGLARPGQSRPDRLYRLLCDRGRHRRQRPELMAMIRAMAEALAFIRAAPAAEIAALIAPRFADVPAEHRVRAIARYQALQPLGHRAGLPARGLRDAGRRHAGGRRRHPCSALRGLRRPGDRHGGAGMSGGMSGRPPVGTRADYRWFTTIPTRWMDNDVYGHVNNVTYYSWIDTAVALFLLENKVLDLATSTEVGLVVETQCRDFAPITFPDSVTCRCAPRPARRVIDPLRDRHLPQCGGGRERRRPFHPRLRVPRRAGSQRAAAGPAAGGGNGTAAAGVRLPGARFALLAWPAAGLALGLPALWLAPAVAPWLFAAAIVPVLLVLLRDIGRGLMTGNAGLDILAALSMGGGAAAGRGTGRQPWSR